MRLAYGNQAYPSLASQVNLGGPWFCCPVDEPNASVQPDSENANSDQARGLKRRIWARFVVLTLGRLLTRVRQRQAIVRLSITMLPSIVFQGHWESARDMKMGRCLAYCTTILRGDGAFVLYCA